MTDLGWSSETDWNNAQSSTDVVIEDGSFSLAEAFPESVIHHYDPDNFSTSSWPDEVGASDFSSITNLSYDDTAFGGSGGVTSAGGGEGETDTMGTFGSNMDSDFSISIPFQTTENDAALLGVDGNNNTACYIAVGDPFGVGWGSGSIVLTISDSDDDRVSVYTDSSYNDGSSHHAIINKTGNSASGINIYIDNMDSAVSTSTESDAPFDNPDDFDSNMAYFARNSGGSVSNRLVAELGNVRWFSDSLTSSQRNTVDDSLPWT